MKKIFLFIVAALMLMTHFVGCTKAPAQEATPAPQSENQQNNARKVTPAPETAAPENTPEPEKVAGTYINRTANSEIEVFTITLMEDGTFQYIESKLSSYIGAGTYTVEDGIVTLEDVGRGAKTCYYKFRHEEGKLIFVQDGSDQFMYKELPDGAEFILND